MSNIINKSWIIEVKAAIRLLDKVVGEEYIAEAEHQDGEEYWMNFTAVSDILQDLVDYRNFKYTEKEVELRIYLHEQLDLMFNRLDFHTEVGADFCGMTLEATRAALPNQRKTIVDRETISVTYDHPYGLFNEIAQRSEVTHDWNIPNQCAEEVEVDLVYYYGDGTIDLDTPKTAQVKHSIITRK